MNSITMITMFMWTLKVVVMAGLLNEVHSPFNSVEETNVCSIRDHVLVTLFARMAMIQSVYCAILRYILAFC